MIPQTQNEKKCYETIKQTKNLITTLNNRLNETLQELDLDADFEKSQLRKIRDKNIETIQLINEMELRGLI